MMRLPTWRSTFSALVVLLGGFSCVAAPASSRTVAAPVVARPVAMGATMAQPTSPSNDGSPSPAVGTTLPDNGGSAEAFAEVSGLDDAQLAGVMGDVLDRAIRMAQLAESKATNTGVRQFAWHIAATGVDTQSSMAALLARLGTVQRDSAAGAQVRADTGRSMTALLMVTGKDFDKTYLDEQLIEAVAALTLLDRIAVRIRSPELAAQEQRLRDEVVARIHAIRALRGAIDHDARF